MYKLLNNLEEIDRKVLILKRKEEARNLRGHKKKIAKRNFLERYKKAKFPQRRCCLSIGEREREREREREIVQASEEEGKM